MRQHPGIKVTDVVKQIAKMWQALPKEAKLNFKELARQGTSSNLTVDKERYLKELREITRCNKTLERPKKPLTPYMLFVREVKSPNCCRRAQRL